MGESAHVHDTSVRVREQLKGQFSNTFHLLFETQPLIGLKVFHVGQASFPTII